MYPIKSPHEWTKREFLPVGFKSRSEGTREIFREGLELLTGGRAKMTKKNFCMSFCQNFFSQDLKSPLKVG